MAPLAAGAGRPVAVDGEVADLGGEAEAAPVDRAVDDEAAADPRPQRDHQHLLVAPAGAVEDLAEGGDVGVVVDHDRHGAGGGQAGPGVDADEAGEVGGVVHGTVEVDEAGEADADGGDAGLGGQEVGHHGSRGAEDGVGPGRRRLAPLGHDLAVLGGGDGEELRAADIDAGGQHG